MYYKGEFYGGYRKEGTKPQETNLSEERINELVGDRVIGEWRTN